MRPNTGPLVNISTTYSLIDRPLVNNLYYTGQPLFANGRSIKEQPVHFCGLRSNIWSIGKTSTTLPLKLLAGMGIKGVGVESICLIKYFFELVNIYISLFLHFGRLSWGKEKVILHSFKKPHSSFPSIKQLPGVSLRVSPR